jgi:hypothetical protein
MSQRGRDFFIMSLARTLGMTRKRLLLEVDSYELSLWQAYFKEERTPSEKKENPEVLKAKLQNLFHARNVQKGKK